MTMTLTYLDPRRTWVTAVLTTGTDVLGPLTGPITTSFPCDPQTSAAYAAVLSGSLVGTIGQTVPPHTPGKKPL